MGIILNSKGEPANVPARTKAIIDAQELLSNQNMMLTEVCAKISHISTAETSFGSLTLIPSGVEKLYFSKSQRVLTGIKILIDTQMKKLNSPENQKKGDGYKKLSTGQLLKAISTEVGELAEAVVDYESQMDESCAELKQEIYKECGDVANYLAMLCENISRQ